MGLWGWLRSKLRTSAVLHVHEEVGSLAAAIDLIDRFLNGEVNYPLEWDDFISWEHPNPTIERLRIEIGEFEPLLFDGERDRYAREISVIRDRYVPLAYLTRGVNPPPS
jgi:hypothetical protein